MKWIKHVVDSADDPDIDDSITLFGSDGYYVFFRTLEVMGREFDINSPGENTFSVEFLRKKYRVSWQKVVKVLSFFQERERIFLKFLDKNRLPLIWLHCPKLQELTDEYTQKSLKKMSGQNHDMCRDKVPIEADKEVDKDINNKSPEPFRLPSKELIENGSQNTILQNIEKVSKEIYDKKIWLDVHAFKNKMIKKNCNNKTILHALTRVLISCPKEPWAYCQTIMTKEDGNFNARDYEKNQR
jgi:hypothetical protein